MFNHRPLSIVHLSSMPLNQIIRALLIFGAIHSQLHLANAFQQPPQLLAGSAYIRSKDRFYIISGIDKDGKNSSQFFYFDLSVPWPASQPAYEFLPGMSDDWRFSGVASSDGKEITCFVNATSGAYTSQYNLSRGSWYRSFIQLPYFSQDIQAVLEPNTGNIFLAGGSMNQTMMVIYYPADQSFQQVFLPPDGMLGILSYRAVWSPMTNGILYFGGWPVSNMASATNILWHFSPTNREWKKMTTNGTPPSPRADFCMAIDDVGSKLVVFGGQTMTTTGTKVATNEMFILDIEKMTWSTGQPHRVALSLHACVLSNSTLISWGGLDDKGAVTTEQIILYDVKSNKYIKRYVPDGFPMTPSAISTSGSNLSTIEIVGISFGCLGGLGIIGAIVLYAMGARLFGGKQGTAHSQLIPPDADGNKDESQQQKNPKQKQQLQQFLQRLLRRSSQPSRPPSRRPSLLRNPEEHPLPQLQRDPQRQSNEHQFTYVPPPPSSSPANPQLQPDGYRYTFMQQPADPQYFPMVSSSQTGPQPTYPQYHPIFTSPGPQPSNYRAP